MRGRLTGMEARMFRAIPIDERPGLFGQFGSWFRAWSRRRARLAELDGCGPAEMEHMARDLGMSRGELSVLAGKWPDSADLLSRRLEQVDLARVEPQVLRDLERVCTRCGSKRKCGLDNRSTPEAETRTTVEAVPQEPPTSVVRSLSEE